jgi:hypothetical protein
MLKDYAMNRAVQLALEMGRTYPSIRVMNISRALLLCLIALFTTAVWAAILYFGARALGIPIGGWLAAMLVFIFFLLLLGLSLGAAASNANGNDESEQEPPS